MAHPFTRLSLQRLSDVDYEVAPGEYDIRGWHVIAANDQRVGKVRDLIIDPAAGKVRYLEVDTDREVLRLDRDRRVLVPIGTAHLDVNDKLMVLSGMTADAISKLPEYTGTVAGDYDAIYGGYLSNAYPPKRMTRSAEELRIDKRLEKKADVRIAKHVETEHVRREVPVRNVRLKRDEGQGKGR